jgi:hypothetical protein
MSLLLSLLSANRRQSDDEVNVRAVQHRRSGQRHRFVASDNDADGVRVPKLFARPDLTHPRMTLSSASLAVPPFPKSVCAELRCLAPWSSALLLLNVSRAQPEADDNHADRVSV